MNEKELEIVKEALSTAGTVGAKGFDFMVRYEVASGVTNILSWGASLAITVYLVKRIFAWKPSDRDDLPHVVRGIGIVVASIFVLLSIGGIFDGVRQLIAPEGAAIARALGK